MTYEMLGKQLRISEGATLEFDYPISEVVEVSDMLIVLLQVRAKESMMENVFGVSKAGHIVWQIEPRPDIMVDPVNRYTGIFPREEGRVMLNVWAGIGVEIDPLTGKVIDWWIGK
jgi:hypothetical protein